MLAEKLGMAHSTIIMDVQVEGTNLRVKRELEGGWFQWIAMPLPAVLTIQSGINQLRYATLKGIMAAKKKEIRAVAAPPAPPPASASSRSTCPRSRRRRGWSAARPPKPRAGTRDELLRDEARRDLG